MKVELKDFKRPDADFTHLVNLDTPTGRREKDRSPSLSTLADLIGLLTLFGIGWLAMIVL